jgi:hypothetical protein
MAIALKLESLQSNDTKVVQLTDTTSEYDGVINTGGWGVANPATSDVVAMTSSTAGKYHVYLNVTYTDSSNNETTYDTIDLYDSFPNEFAKAYGMEYKLNISNLKVSGVSEGSSSDAFPDGFYEVEYVIREADTLTVLDRAQYQILVYGVIQIKVYDYVRETTNVIYKQKQFLADERDWQSLMDSSFVHSYFTSLITNDAEALKTEKLEMLYFLEQKLNN